LSRKTGIVKDTRYLRHGTGYGHPESPQRLEAIYAMLDTPPMKGCFTEIAPRYAEIREIEMIHRPSHIDRVMSTAGKAHCMLDPDTETSPESCDVARLAAGGLCNAVDSVVSGQTDNAFAFVRPPGHHAEADAAAGFCIFNNIAIAAMHALEKHGLKRVLIIDWDLHHGNGTQHSFFTDKRVLYFSTHQFPAYPGTGGIEEIGTGAGMGYTVNVPLRPGADDSQYVRVFRRILQPVALAYKPELILVSAGFDIYHRDPLGAMRVTPRGFALLTRIIMDIADRCCGGRVVLVLEGGYDIDGLVASVKAVLNELCEANRVPEAELADVEKTAEASTDAVIARVIDQINPLWRVF
jgi:acetoin utilization deacetylase AcuC-like enzyme